MARDRGARPALGAGGCRRPGDVQPQQRIHLHEAEERPDEPGEGADGRIPLEPRMLQTEVPATRPVSQPPAATTLRTHCTSSPYVSAKTTWEPRMNMLSGVWYT